MTSHTNRNWAIALGLILLVGVGYVYTTNGGSLPLGNVGGSAPVGNTQTPITPSTPNSYTDAVNFVTVATHTTNGTAATLDTNVDIVFFWKNPDGTYQRAGAASDGSESITVGNHDVIYVEATVPSGQAFFIDAPNTMARNPDLKSVAYVDATTDGVPTYMFGWDISAIKAKGNPQFAPTATWYLQVVADQTFTMASASSILSVGTGTKSSTIQSNISIDTNGGGESFKAAQVRVNGTQSTNEVAEEQSYWHIPNASKPGGFEDLYLSQMTASYDYSSSGVSIFRKDYSYTVDGANLVVVPQVGSKQINIPATITTNMDASNDAVCVELRLEPINAQNVAGTALTDDVELAQGATNTNECTIT